MKGRWVIKSSGHAAVPQEGQKKQGLPVPPDIPTIELDPRGGIVSMNISE